MAGKQSMAAARAVETEMAMDGSLGARVITRSAG